LPLFKSMSLLEVKNISKKYGATIAFNNCNISINESEIHVLIGSNGSGKSTLCKIISGSVQADKGEIFIENKKTVIKNPIDSKNLGISTFYQELSIANHASVEENVFMNNLPSKYFFLINRKKLRSSALQFYDLFKNVAGEDFTLSTPVNQLREDQRQIVEIMKVLASNTKIMIFDEPTSALDKAQVECFFKILKNLKKHGHSIIFISHRMNEIFEVGDKITILRDAEVISTNKLSDIDQDTIIKRMIGEKNLTPNPQRQNNKIKTPALTIQNLNGKNFDNISLEILKGEIIGIGGLHGQGQSSLLRSIFGILPIKSGKIFVENKILNKTSPRKSINNGLSYISGDRKRDGIFPGRSIFENIFPIHFYKNKKIFTNRNGIQPLANNTLDLLKTVYSNINQEITNLSGGNQQKIIIARWLINSPLILLLDDPAKGIDLSAKADLYSLINKLAEKGVSIILYSSDDVELLTYSDRIFVFNNGKITKLLKGSEKNKYNLYEASYDN